MVPTNPTIILVDPERLLLDLLAGHLRAVGVLPITADSAESVIAMSRDGASPAVVAINPDTPALEVLLANASSYFPDAKVFAFVESDEKLNLAATMEVEVLDKRQSLDVTVQRMLAAAGVRDKYTGTEESVLIVDDEESIRRLLSEFLEGRGYRTVKAQNGDEALRLIEQDPSIGVVLLDIMMPGKGGMEVLNDLRQSKRRPVVIMMTSLADASIAQAAMRAGAFNYILKPPNLSELESNISAGFSCLQLHHRHRFGGTCGAA